MKKRNFDLGQSLDERHSRKDIKLFRLNRLFYVQEDVFKYFYPFCLINVPLSSCVVLRRVLTPSQLMLVAFLTAEYVYLMFQFPIENHHFHKTALDSRAPYS